MENGLPFSTLYSRPNIMYIYLYKKFLSTALNTVQN